MGKKAGVPEKAKMMVATADMISAKSGCAMTWVSRMKTPVWGAVAGRSWTPTAIVSVRTKEVSVALFGVNETLSWRSILT